MSFRIMDESGSVCRHCRHYRPEGRRGGHCGLLGADVQGDWAACHLAVPPFAPSWERLEGLGMPLVPGDVLGGVAVKPHWHCEQPLVLEG
jgi:hypothetical protein